MRQPKTRDMNPSNFIFAIFLIGQAALPPGTFAQTSNFELISFKLADKFILVRGSADGRPGNFIIDTGFDGVLLNHLYFEGKKNNKVVHGINGRAGEVGIKYVELSLGMMGAAGKPIQEI